MKRVFELILISVLAAANVWPEPLELIPKGAQWRYSDDFEELEAEWRSPSFDDQNWKSGSGLFGFGIGNEVTKLAKPEKQITYYFRKRFDLPANGLNGFDGLVIELMKDAGVVVYLNGERVLHLDLPPEPRFRTESVFIRDEEKTQFVRYDLHLSRDLLVEGENTIAVELHARNPGTGEARFDMSVLLDDWASGPPIILRDDLSVASQELVDLDGDGILDLLFSSENLKLAWRRGLGHFQFANEKIFPDLTGTVQYHVVDTDGDNDLDVLIRNVGKLRMFLNSGGGVFEPIDLPALERENVGNSQFAHGDLTGNALPDIALLWEDSDGMTGIDWMENTGDNSFRPKGTIWSGKQSTYGRISTISLGKLDSDNLDDVVFQTLGNRFRVLRILTEGVGGFSIAKEQRNVKAGDDLPVFFDLNGDNGIDAIYNAHFSLVDGGGSFTAEGDNFAIGEKISPVDYNQDGIVDIASSLLSKGVVVAQLDPTASFSKLNYFEPLRQRSRSLPVYSSAPNIATGDVGGDERPELIAAYSSWRTGFVVHPNWSSGKLPRIYRATAEPSVLKSPGTSKVEWDIRGAESVEVFDSSGVSLDPSALDVRETSTYTVKAAAGNSVEERHFTVFLDPFERIDFPAGMEARKSLLGTDLNRDGNQDVIALTGSQLKVMHRSDANLEEVQSFGIKDQGTIQIVDINGDQIPDVSVDNEYESGHPLGSHIFTVDTEGLLNKIDSSQGLARDFNGDGLIDIVNFPEIRINSGNGIFGETTEVLSEDPRFEQYDVKDLDGDSHPDVVGWKKSGTFSEIIAYRFVNGEPFGEEFRIGLLPSAELHFEVHDLDNDQDPDLLVSWGDKGEPNGTGQAVLFRNDAGEFSQPLSIDPAIGARWLRSRDVNGDGLIDLVNFVTGRWLSNQGGGHFKSESDLPMLQQHFTDFVDFDGDGDLDISGRDHDDRFVFYRNNLREFSSEGKGALPEIIKVSLDESGDLIVSVEEETQSPVFLEYSADLHEWTRHDLEIPIGAISYRVDIDNLAEGTLYIRLVRRD